MKTSILQHGACGSDLIVYAHIDGSILAPKVPTVTSDAFVTLFAGLGTSAYRTALSNGGWSRLLSELSEELGFKPRRTALITWSAGSEVAMAACASKDVPDVIIMLDGLYAGKPKGSVIGDGQVTNNPGLDAVTACVTAAARREKTVRMMNGESVETERRFVIFHSRIATTYASSKECAEYVQARVEEALGEKMKPATDVDATLLDGHFFAEALALGNLRIIEFAGANAGEHIREAHLWDEAAKLWIPWLQDAPICAGPKTSWDVPLVLELDVVKPYMRGDDVTAWQRFLTSEGLNLNVDGVYGPETAKQTSQWQRAYGLSETAKLDAATYHAATGAGFSLKPGTPVPATSNAISLAEVVVARARKDVGVFEDRGNNDGTRIREMGTRYGWIPGSNWCGIAVSDWIIQAAADMGAKCPIVGSQGAQAIMGQFKSIGRWLPASEARKNPSLVTAGMVPVFDRSVPGRPETGWMGHIGVTTGGVTNGKFPTIEGNSGADGRRVAEMVRDLSDGRLFGFGKL